MLVNAARSVKDIGSTTAVIVSLDKQEENAAQLQTCNLGDSGYLIVRPSDNFSTVFRSKEQTWAFNAPEQCGTNCALPYQADKNVHTVLHDDIVVLGSDGLFDNLFDDEIKRCLQKEHLQKTRRSAWSLLPNLQVTKRHGNRHSGRCQSVSLTTKIPRSI